MIISLFVAEKFNLCLVLQNIYTPLAELERMQTIFSVRTGQFKRYTTGSRGFGPYKICSLVRFDLSSNFSLQLFEILLVNYSKNQLVCCVLIQSCKYDIGWMVNKSERETVQLPQIQSVRQSLYLYSALSIRACTYSRTTQRCPAERVILITPVQQKIVRLSTVHDSLGEELDSRCLKMTELAKNMTTQICALKFKRNLNEQPGTECSKKCKRYKTKI